MKRILKDDGILWLNIGDSFSRKTHGSIRQKERIGIPWMLAFALREGGRMDDKAGHSMGEAQCNAGIDEGQIYMFP